MPAGELSLKYPHAAIAVFAREPVLGAVKTRLQAAIGAESALALYTAMLTRTWGLLQDAQLARPSLWVTSNPSHESFLSICNKREIFLQSGADLGQRMQHCTQSELARPDTNCLLLIGTDCPALEAAYLDTALAALNGGQDLVLGPASDGGYVLIGLRKAQPALFQGVSWGTDAVLAQTLGIARDCGLQTTVLAELWDVDEFRDLARLQELKPPLDWP